MTYCNAQAKLDSFSPEGLALYEGWLAFPLAIYVTREPDADTRALEALTFETTKNLPIMTIPWRSPQEGESHCRVMLPPAMECVIISSLSKNRLLVSVLEEPDIKAGLAVSEVTSIPIPALPAPFVEERLPGEPLAPRAVRRMMSRKYADYVRSLRRSANRFQVQEALGGLNIPDRLCNWVSVKGQSVILAPAWTANDGARFGEIVELRAPGPTRYVAIRQAIETLVRASAAQHREFPAPMYRQSLPEDALYAAATVHPNGDALVYQDPSRILEQLSINGWDTTVARPMLRWQALAGPTRGGGRRVVSGTVCFDREETRLLVFRPERAEVAELQLSPFIGDDNTALTPKIIAL